MEDRSRGAALEFETAGGIGGGVIGGGRRADRRVRSGASVSRRNWHPGGASSALPIHRFGSKEGLILRVIERTRVRLVSAWSDAMQRSEYPEDEPSGLDMINSGWSPLWRCSRIPPRRSGPI